MKDEDFNDLVESFQQAIRWAKGEDVPGVCVHHRTHSTLQQSANAPD